MAAKPVSTILEVLVSAGLAIGVMGCGDSGNDPSAGPLVTVERILDLHGLNGRRIEARHVSDRRRKPDPVALRRLFIDYDAYDPFLADLYVGFIAGVLARHQEILVASVAGGRAGIRAGETVVHLRLKEGVWRVSLRESVPESIKIRARHLREQIRENGRISAR